MSLTIYNVLSRDKEVFKPIDEGRVTMYVCGPTVYDNSHLGHAKTYVSFDVVVRWLRYSGYRVRYVQNITDVGHLLDDGEDRILKGAKRERVEPMEIVERYMRSYFEDMDALGVTRPDISPRASAHIPEQIEMIQQLLDKGFAYEVNGTVYFSVEAFDDYGKLSGRRVEEMEAGKRVAVRDEKRHPMDFAVWIKSPENHLLQWPSPWGRGYPGWHIECSAMSTKYLGANFDIHGGGVDNIFPHNECEIAQSEAANGQPFAELLDADRHAAGRRRQDEQVTGQLRHHQGRAPAVPARGAALLHLVRAVPQPGRLQPGRRWRRPPRAPSASASPPSGCATRSRIRRTTDEATTGRLIDIVDQHRMRFTSAMNDDFNAPLALSALFDMSKDINTAISDGTASKAVLEHAHSAYRELAGDVLGVLRAESTPASTGSAEREARLIELLIDLRLEARKAKDYSRADAIRNRLAQAGIILEDGPAGTAYRIND